MVNKPMSDFDKKKILFINKNAPAKTPEDDDSLILLPHPNQQNGSDSPVSPEQSDSYSKQFSDACRNLVRWDVKNMKENDLNDQAPY